MAKVKYKGKNNFVTYKRIKLFSMIIPLFRYLFGQKSGVFRLVVRKVWNEGGKYTNFASSKTINRPTASGITVRNKDCIINKKKEQ